MKLKDDAGWSACLANNQDPYGGAVLKYAEAWADAMEAAMVGGKSVADVAGECEPKGHGITGFQYGVAVATLVGVWEHGAALKAWHNGNYGCPEAAGVVNPAIITIG